jgi:hypothetical protein
MHPRCASFQSHDYTYLHSYQGFLITIRALDLDNATLLRTCSVDYYYHISPATTWSYVLLLRDLLSCRQHGRADLHI